MTTIEDIVARLSALHNGSFYDCCDASDAFHMRAEDDIRFLLDAIAQRDKQLSVLRNNSEFWRKGQLTALDSCGEHLHKANTVRAALRKYGHHEPSCCPALGEKKDAVCTCGLAEALARAGEEHT